MLAERAAVAEGRDLPPSNDRQARGLHLLQLRQRAIERAWINRIEIERDRVFALVEQAAPYIDAVTILERRGWLPSPLLKLTYWTVRTGPNPDNSFAALNYIERMLDLARERHAQGLDPNPFINDDAVAERGQ
jgi:hypothetical protein